MIETVTPQQVDQYRDNGFLVLEGFLNDAELARWRHDTDEAVEQRLAAMDPNVGLEKSLTNQADPDNYYARVFTQCLKLAESHAGMRELIYDPRLGRIAATLAGVSGIRVWHDQALFKPPFGNPTAFHLDNPYWSFSSRDSLSIWLALDDATTVNGCMAYLPGTHHSARFENVGIGMDLGDLFRVYPEWRAINPVVCPCPAGTAVFHNGLTAHAAGCNLTNRPRRAMTCAYMPDGSTFNGTRNILPEAYFNSLSIGDPLTDDAVNPLLWRE